MAAIWIRSTIPGAHSSNVPKLGSSPSSTANSILPSRAACNAVYSALRVSGVERSGGSHHANPVAEWCFDAVEVRTPPGDPGKPEHAKTGTRIDAVPTTSMALAAPANGAGD